VTGGSGFVGSHAVRALLDRGDHVRVLARGAREAESLAGLEDVQRISGSVFDTRALRRALKGADLVVHAAGLVSFRGPDRARLFELNTEGTRAVIEEAKRAGIERVVHVSSAGTFGPAPATKTIDESQVFRAGSLGIAYVNSKREAEVEAMRVAATGLDVVCINPTVAFGPGDTAARPASIVPAYLGGRIVAFVPGTINVVDVRDVAQMVVAADELGRTGDRYILGGRNFTSDRLFADLARLSGAEPPPKLPYRTALAIVVAADRAGVRSGLHADQVRAAGQHWAYRSDKARRELGFSPRPHERTLEDSVAWHLERMGGRAGERPVPPLTMRFAMGAAGAFGAVARRFG